MLSADLVDERGAVLRTDMNVEKHDVDGAVGQPLARLRQARSLANDPAFELEVQPAEETDRRVVVDHEHMPS
jgi:hypothetical protein